MTVEVICFVDTNVLIYALDATDPKSAIAERLIEHRPTLSVQVINEVVSGQTKKLRRPMRDALNVAAYLMQRCRVVASLSPTLSLAINSSPTTISRCGIR